MKTYIRSLHFILLSTLFLTTGISFGFNYKPYENLCEKGFRPTGCLAHRGICKGITTPQQKTSLSTHACAKVGKKCEIDQTQQVKLTYPEQRKGRGRLAARICQMNQVKFCEEMFFEECCAAQCTYFFEIHQERTECLSSCLSAYEVN
ncbi:MAG: hypothetical protein R3B45_07355 [Bdellovibrionota bacterium]